MKEKSSDIKNRQAIISSQYNINVIRKRFLLLNNSRLLRMRDALANRHRMILDVLPLLFHSNHPMMPGFVSLKTPNKIVNFTPAREHLLAGKHIARSFTYRHQPNKAADITGLYIMGSVGTIAQSENSDLDIWVCYNSDMPACGVLELQQKCRRITHWASEQKLEVHFFLMDPAAFRRGELSALDKESSGSAQRMLLLDEFYRSAIYLAGGLPAWWFVPAEEHINYNAYLHNLTHLGHLAKDDIIDFGDTSHIPSNEFIGAGIWQLYKAIESPYKSVLKVLLLESYVSQYPHIQPLSLTFKYSVYHGESDIDKLDSYLLVYQKIENYLLSKKQLRRLELARRCFYLKINKPLTKPIGNKDKSWQRLKLESLVNMWEWDHEQLVNMDQHGEWKTQQVYKERNILVAELNHSYHVLLQFSNSTHSGHSISNEELTILGRKLNAAFEKRPGKLEWINPGISNDLSEDSLTLATTSTRDRRTLWHCYNHTPHNKPFINAPAIRPAAGLIETLLWLQVNEISHLHTHFDLSLAPTFSPFKLRNILSCLRHWQAAQMTSLEHETFRQPAQCTHILLLFDVDKPSQKRLQQSAQQHTQQQTTQRVLDYPQNHDFHVFSADIAIRNSWNEIHVEHFEGEEALINILSAFLDASQTNLHASQTNAHNKPPEYTIESIGSEYSANMSKKLNRWFEEIVHCFYRDHLYNSRYIFEYASKLYCIQHHMDKYKIHGCHSSDQLIEHLGHEQAHYSPIVFDSESLKGHALRLIARNSEAGAMHVFYRTLNLGMEIYVVDEKGSITYSMYRGRKDHNPLKPLHRFMRAAIRRQLNNSKDLIADFGIYPINFYQLHIVGSEKLSLQRVQVSPDTRHNPTIEIVATAYNKDITHTDGRQSKQLLYNFHCDNVSFTFDEYGTQIFSNVARFIISRQKNNTCYPVYLHDLDLTLWKKNPSDLAQLQLSHYLRIKNALEYQLNKTIRQSIFAIH